MKSCSKYWYNQKRREVYGNYAPFCIPVGNPIETTVTWAPIAGAPKHRVQLSLPAPPGGNHELRSLSLDTGVLTTTFTPPEGKPTNDQEFEDLREVWFACQPMPAGAAAAPYVFQEVDQSISTDVRRVITITSNGLGDLTFVADLQLAFERVFATIEKVEDLGDACAECGEAAVGVREALKSGSKVAVIVAAAKMAAAQDECRVCIKTGADKVRKKLEEMRQRAAFGSELQRELDKRIEGITGSARDHDRATEGARQVDRWREIERIA